MNTNDSELLIFKQLFSIIYYNNTGDKQAGESWAKLR